MLIVDDEKPSREGLRAALEGQYDVYLAEDAVSARRLLDEERFDVMLSDLRMPGEDGLKLIQRAKSLPHPPVCILMTAYGSEELAVQAMKQGADDYISKGRLQLDELEMRLAKLLRARGLERENVALQQQLDERYGLHEIVGDSPAIREVHETIKQVAPSRATVLIEGESGAGKELVARAIHALSPRAKGPFLAVHCAALSANLLESELFGHERGAFTGAVERRQGRFELADGGTLFLDEIANVPPGQQAKLLRVLETREFERVGSSKTRAVNARILSATNANLRDEVEAGRFREDLLYRLNTVEIAIPALRDRREDIPPLAEHFLKRNAAKYRKDIAGFAKDATEALLRHAWPGNVRELEHAMERAVLMAGGGEIREADLFLRMRGGDAPRLEDLSLEEMEKLLIQKAIGRFDGNVSRTADALGLSRSALYRRLQRYDL